LRACGVAYLALLAETENAPAIETLSHAAASLFASVAQKRCLATLLHAPVAVKERIGFWSATPAGFPLMQRLKAAFDPQNVFAPGRFVGGL
jgi:FAD/FMN-containing dehydrogenase